MTQPVIQLVLQPLYHLPRLIRRAVVSLLCVAGIVALLPRPALAHPMGNFSVNRHSRLTVGAERVTLLYVVDMAEIPTHSERSAMDTNRDGTISTQEVGAYLDSLGATLPARLVLTLNGTAATWTVESSTLEFAAGQADLPTLRMEFGLAAPLTPSQGVQELHYRENGYAGRLGWQEIVVTPGVHTAIVEADVPQTDISNALAAYPVDLLQNPPVRDSATIRWQAVPNMSDQMTGQTKLIPAATADQVGRAWAAGEGFEGLIAVEWGLLPVLLALLAAFGWGAAHALSPGHGKTIVAAYLVGARGTIAHALFLGMTTTITHTLGVFVLGLAMLVAAQFMLPERIYPWLSTISGLLVITIGVSIGWKRLRGLVRGESPHHHDHTHDHTHDHEYDHVHHHEHHHAHDHHHSHMTHTHAPHEHAPHEHGGHIHSHLPPGTDGSTVTWRGLLALGISGGLLPCPSALVVLLGAIALGRVAFGLVLILVFSLGLATVLTLFGILLLRAGQLFARVPESGRYARYLAVASAAFITLVGAGITVRALIETGILAGLA